MLIVVVPFVQNVMTPKHVTEHLTVSVVSATTTYVFVSMTYFQISNMIRSLIIALQSCGDEIKNQDETDVDCGGLICSKCDHMKVCKIELDCASGVCASNICQGSSIV